MIFNNNNNDNHSVSITIIIIIDSLIYRVAGGDRGAERDDVRPRAARPQQRAYTRSPSQDSPSQDFRQGLECSGTHLFIGSGYDFPGSGSEKTGIL